MGYPLGGAPLGPLEPPKGSPDVLEVWKKLQKFPKINKKFTCRKIPQIITLTPILEYLHNLGGPQGVKIFRGGVVGHFPPPMKFLKKFPGLVLVIRTY